MLIDLKIGDSYDGFLFLAESVRNPPSLRSHRHAELELNVVKSGTVTYVMEGVRYTFAKRSLLWFFPDQEHQLVDRSADAAYYVAVFKPEMIKNACQGSRYKPTQNNRPIEKGVLHTELKPDVFEHLCKNMDTLTEDGVDPDILNREAGFGLNEGFRFTHHDPDWLNAGLRYLLLHTWRLQLTHSKKQNQVSLHPSVRKTLELLENSNGYADLASLAQACHVSAPYLSSTFHKQIGVSLARYRNSVRLNRFWEAYRKPETQTILEAVYQAGFGSYAQFYRVFLNVYGQSPRQSLKNKISS